MFFILEQSCGTWIVPLGSFWFETEEDAREYIDKYLDITTCIVTESLGFN